MLFMIVNYYFVEAFESFGVENNLIIPKSRHMFENIFFFV